MPEYVLDQTDINILHLLQIDGRLSHRQLGAMVNLSVTPIHIRVRRLEELKYIKRFTAILDARKVGLGLIGYVKVQLAQHTEDSLTDFMREAVKLEEVMECYHTSGPSDFLMRIAIANMEEYNKILVNKLTKLPGQPHFESSFVLSEGKRETAFVLK